MGKKENKLREALGKLFKARGEFVEITNEAKTARQSNFDKHQLNAGLEDTNRQQQNQGLKKPKSQPTNKEQNTTSMTSKKKTAQKLNSNLDEIKTKSVKHALETNKTKTKLGPKQTKTINKNQQNSIKVDTQNGNIKKQKRKKAGTKKQTNSEDDTTGTAGLPRGYFVMNHAAAKSEPKKNSENHEKKTSKAAEQEKKKFKKTKKDKEIENQELETKPPKKRKANKDNEPQNKVFKKQNLNFESASFSEPNETNKFIEEYLGLSKLNRPMSISSTSSSSYETDTTESSYSDSFDDETLTEDSDEHDFSFESDDLDDTYSEQSASDVSFADSESFNSIHDPDYELPKTVIEDHIVHQGLAVKHDITAELDIQFDEHNDSAQVIELPSLITNVEQHESLNPEHLRTLEFKFVEQIKITSTANKPAIKHTSEPAIKHRSESDDCPELVPIDDVNFRLWTSGIEMDDDIFSNCSLEEFDDSDEESITAAEGNINDKYLKNDETSTTDSEEDENVSYDEADESVSYDETEEVEDMEEFARQKPQKGLNMKADVMLAELESLDAYDFEKDEQNSNEECSLAEIILRTLGFFDSSNVVIKTAIVNDVEETNENGKFQTAAEMLDCVPSCRQVENESPNAELLDEPFVNDQSVSDVSNDSTTQDIHIEVEEEAVEISPTPKFKTLFFNSIDSHQVLVLLKSPFYVYGTVKVTLIAGAAEIFGYQLKKWETQQLYSPRGVCALEILPRTTSSNALESKEDILAVIGSFSHECEFHSHNLNELLKNFEPSTDAILLLARNDEAVNVKSVLQLHVKENIFPAQIPQSRPFYASEFLLDCMINVSTEYPLHIPPQWSQLRLESSSKFLLVGGKSVGKSTLLRFLVNQHLNKFSAVLVIDLDIGQPEIFASQAVSCALVQQPLLGPGFFHNIKPDKAFCVAHSNIVLCAHRYMTAVIELLQYCSEEPRYQHIPCIVNTMGYNKGLGAELIAVVAEHLRPTDIVQLHSNVPINNFDYLFEPHVVPTIERNIFNRMEYAATNRAPLTHRLIVMPSAVLQQGRYQREWQMSAKDMRYVMLLTHLSRILNEQGEILNTKQTYCVSMDAIKITSPLSRRAQPLDVAKSLVSNLVYLGYSEENSTIDTIVCYGIGIVRAIDWPTRQLYLLTSLPGELLKKVNTLTAGDMPLPTTLLTLQDLDINTDVPFVQNVVDEATSRAVRQFYKRT